MDAPQVIFRAVVVVAVVAGGTSSQSSDAQEEDTPDRVSATKEEVVLWGCQGILKDCARRHRAQSCRAWLKYC